MSYQAICAGLIEGAGGVRNHEIKRLREKN
jgi:hypothetical protein